MGGSHPYQTVTVSFGRAQVRRIARTRNLIARERQCFHEPEADLPVLVVRGRLPAATTLSGADATADTVLGELGGHGWAHLCCHGRQDPTAPASSTLYLHDRPLTVSEIAEHDFSHGQLAYLSACETSTGGVRLLDEAMHLSAAFQTAGFRHVVATLWTINDDSSAQIADDVYAELTASGRSDPADTARSLHRAVLRLRDERLHAPLVWAPYVHSGP